MTLKEYLKLLQLLQRYNYEYHTLNKTTVSDDVYDSLMVKIKAFEEKNPQQIASFSPTQRVGGALTEKFSKASHSQLVLSLNDVFSFEEVVKWQARLKKLAPTVKDWHYFVDIKMDGLALVLIYEDGLFKQAITRGDGRIGEDVTVNAKTIRNLPLKLPQIRAVNKYTKGRLEIRGEVLLYKEDFKKINQKNLKAGLTTYANARNLAAGTMRQLDSKLVFQRQLAFRAYDIVGQSFVSQKEVHQTLKLLNISHNHQAQVCSNLETLKSVIESLQQQRHSLPFSTDGLVIRINDRQVFEQLGAVAKAPRAALAYKYPPEQVTTLINDIILQIGRTGAITPVAVLKPVKLAGSMITHASLHNADEIKRLDVRRGDTVIIFKAGDIIPKIEKVIHDLRPKNAESFNFEKELKKQYPKLEFERQQGEVAYRLTKNSAQLSNHLTVLALTHYASRLAVDIEGLAQANAQALVDAKLVNNLADLYNLSFEQLIVQKRFADLSSRNLISAIAQRKNPALDKFIFGLGIPQVGSQTALDLARHFKTFEKFSQASAQDFEALEGIGSKTALAITNWFASASNLKLLQDFKAAKVQPLEFKTLKKRLFNKRVVLTGSLQDYSRYEIQQMIIAEGGQMQTQVGSKTDYLVTGQKPGKNKLKMAKVLKIKILNEAEFKNLINFK